MSTTTLNLKDLTQISGLTNPNAVLEIANKIGISETKNFDNSQCEAILEVIKISKEQEISHDQAIALYMKKTTTSSVVEEEKVESDLSLAYQSLGNGYLTQNNQLGKQLGVKAVDELVLGMVQGTAERLTEAHEALGKFMGQVTIEIETKELSPAFSPKPLKPVMQILTGSK
jgi:hypothetical protein